MGEHCRYPDQTELARIGETVRQRLAADPTVYRVPVERAEIFAVAAFLSSDECSHLIAAIDEVARPSDVYHSVEQTQFRTSYSGDLDARDSFVRMIERRLGDLTGLDLAWGETIQGQRYHPGQEFRAHYDWFDIEAAYWHDERDVGGQRSWTGMVYLNDVEEGGVTEFPLLDIRIEPQAGALILWNNALPDGRPNPDVLHAALPVTRGVKYIITKWFRAREWGHRS
jgi:prolyl 4-hydroxylase